MSLIEQFKIGDEVLIRTWTYPTIRINEFESYEGTIVAMTINAIKLQSNHRWTTNARWFNIDTENNPPNSTIEKFIK